MAIYGDSKKVILGENTRWSYLSIFEPKSINSERPKYSVSLIIKKDSPDMQKISEAIKDVYNSSTSILKDIDGTVPSVGSIRLPVRDGDTEKPNDDAYKGCYYINAYTVYKPGIVDVSCNPITDESAVYSGCYGRASINFYAYNNGEASGIACSLNNLQKVKDGDRLDGKVTASAEFKSVSSAADDFATASSDSLPF